MCRLRTGRGRLSLLHLIRTPTKWIPSCFLQRERYRGVKLTSLLHLAPRIRMREIVHPPSVFFPLTVCVLRYEEENKFIYVSNSLSVVQKLKLPQFFVFAWITPTSDLNWISGIQSKCSHCGDEWGAFLWAGSSYKWTVYRHVYLLPVLNLYMK